MTQPIPSPAADVPIIEPTAAQQRILDRIDKQRERLRARRAAHKQAQALARQSNAMPGAGADDSFALRAAAFAREHPLAIAAVGGVALVAGPRRLIRWAGVLLPLLMRLKR